MNATAELVLNVLESRSAWKRGVLHMPLEEISQLIQTRFPQAKCPSAGQIEREVSYLLKYRRIKWARIRDGELLALL